MGQELDIDVVTANIIFLQSQEIQGSNPGPGKNFSLEVLTIVKKGQSIDTASITITISLYHYNHLD